MIPHINFMSILTVSLTVFSAPGVGLRGTAGSQILCTIPEDGLNFPSQGCGQAYGV